MTRETSEIAARAARDIRESSMAAYQERQRTMEYIDYKRTGTIRGEKEWMAQAEGGAGGEPCPFRGERFGIHHLISSRERNFSIMATVLSIFSSPTASSKSMSSSS